MRKLSGKCSTLILLAAIMAVLLPTISFAHPTEAASEMVDMRTASSKHWRNANGSVTVEFGTGPIHYKDPSGRWQDINTNLAAGTREGYSYSVETSALRVHLAAIASGWQAIEIGDTVLTFKAETLNASHGVVTGNSIKYPDAWPSADLVYQVLPTGLKEDIILRRQPTTKQFRFTIRSGLLRAVATEDGGNDYFDLTGKAALRTLAPFMKDARGRICHKIETNWEANPDGSVTLTLEPDQLWLKTAQYPVVIDPSTKLWPVDDRYTEQWADGRPPSWYDYYDYSGIETLIIGRSIPDPELGVVRNRCACIKFDVSDIPTAAYATSAEIKLTVPTTPASATGKKVGMAKSVYPWPPGFLTLGSTLVTNHDWAPGTQIFSSYGFRGVVDEWIHNSSTNHGVVFFCESTGEYDLYCYSAEWENVDEQPRLYVTFTDTKAPWWDVPDEVIIINGGNSETDSRNVRLDFNIEDGWDGSGVYKMQINESGVRDDSPSAWINYQPTIEWTLSSGNTPKTLYAWFMDYAGNKSIRYQSSINLVESTSSISFSPPGGRAYPLPVGVEIGCSLSNVTLRYTTDGSVPIAPNDTNPNSTTRTYDPDGVVVVNPVQTISVKAFDANNVCQAERSATYYLPEPGGTPVYQVYQVVDEVEVDPPTINDLRLTDIWPVMDGSTTENHTTVAWEDGGTDPEWTFAVKRKLESDNRNWDEIDALESSTSVKTVVDDTGVTLGTPYRYAVQRLPRWTEDRSSYLLPNPPTGTSSRLVYRRIRYKASPWSEITVVPSHVQPSHNQTVDSREDPRLVQIRPLDHVFLATSGGGGVHNGGLFVGTAISESGEKDPSKIGRSFLKFPLIDARPQQENRLWDANLNAFFTGMFRSDYAGQATVNCYLVDDHFSSSYPTSGQQWTASELNWSYAPSLTGLLPIDYVTVAPTTTYGCVAPGNWCIWDDMFKVIPGEMYGDGVLSAGLARTDESETTRNAWAYFAKKEYDVNLAPQILYAYGHIINPPTGTSPSPVFPVHVWLDDSSVQGGTYAIGHVRLNGPAPDGGVDITIRSQTYPYQYAIASMAHINSGSLEGTFVVSTAILRSGDADLVTVPITASRLGFSASTNLTISKQPQQ